MNVALHLHSLGLDVSIASKVGNDEAGRELVAFLNSSGVSTDLVEVDAYLPTSQVFVHLDENNNATYEICEPVAWDNLTLTDALVKRARNRGCSFTDRWRPGIRFRGTLFSDCSIPMPSGLLISTCASLMTAGRLLKNC